MAKQRGTLLTEVGQRFLAGVPNNITPPKHITQATDLINAMEHVLEGASEMDPAGSLLFDRSKGYLSAMTGTARSGDIGIDAAGALLGGWCLIRHNDASANFDISGATLIVPRAASWQDVYQDNQDNLMFFRCVSLSPFTVVLELLGSGGSGIPGGGIAGQFLGVSGWEDILTIGVNNEDVTIQGRNIWIPGYEELSRDDGVLSRIVGMDSQGNLEVSTLASSGIRVVPTGGNTGQVLQKSSSSDFDLEWADVSSGGGGGLSVSGTPSQGDVIQEGSNGAEWVTPVDIYGQTIAPADLSLLQDAGNYDANNQYNGSALAGDYPAGTRVFDGEYLLEYTGTSWHRIAKILGTSGGLLVDGTPSQGDIIQEGASGPEWVTPVDIYGQTISPTDLALLQDAGNYDSDNVYTGSALSATFPAGTRLFDGEYLLEYTGAEWHRIRKVGGQDGADGVGVPPGGTAGQILSKIDAADYNTQWIPAPSGGGASALNDLSDAGADASERILNLAGDLDIPALVASTYGNLLAIGHGSGGNISFANASGDLSTILIGQDAGAGAEDVDRAVYIGKDAGRGSNGSDNLFLGVESGENHTGGSCVYIGLRAGRSLTESNSLRIVSPGSGGGDFLIVRLGAATDGFAEVFLPVLPFYENQEDAMQDGMRIGQLFRTTVATFPSGHAGQIDKHGIEQIRFEAYLDNSAALGGGLSVSDVYFNTTNNRLEQVT